MISLFSNYCNFSSVRKIWTKWFEPGSESPLSGEERAIFAVLHYFVTAAHSMNIESIWNALTRHMLADWTYFLSLHFFLSVLVVSWASRRVYCCVVRKHFCENVLFVNLHTKANYFFRSVRIERLLLFRSRWMPRKRHRELWIPTREWKQQKCMGRKEWCGATGGL